MFISFNKLKRLFQKPYDQRNQSQHSQAIHFLQTYFSIFSNTNIKIITFFLEFIDKSKLQKNDITLQHGFWVIFSSTEHSQVPKNPQQTKEIRLVKNQKVIFPEDQSFGLYLRYDNYLSCITLGQTTVEEEIAFFQTSEYLCSMQKKKFYSLLRNAKVLQFTYRQIVYHEGQKIVPGESGSGVYFVRKGELAYVKRIKQQDAEIFKFGPGHLIGTLQFEGRQSHRLFSVKCKSGRCLVYQINLQFFKQIIKPHCQQLLKSRLSKLEHFLTDKSKKIEHFRDEHKEFNFKLRKSYSNLNDDAKNERISSNIQMFTSRDLPSLIKTSKNSEEIQNGQLLRNSSLALKNESPLKNYPKTLQRSKFLESDFGEMEKLRDKNEKISKIRAIKNIQTSQTRQSILFSLFKSSWNFQKQRRHKNY